MKFKMRSSLVATDVRVSIEQFVAQQQLQPRLSEDDAAELVWQMHPDLDELRQAKRLPKEFVDEEGNPWNPRMHIEMHFVIERQLASDEPAGIADLAIGYEREGILDSHEVRHALASAVGDELWLMTQEKIPFDNDRYFSSIADRYRQFVASKKNSGSDR
jgi:hypothetical protein